MSEPSAIDLADLHQAILGPDEVDALFTDIGALAEVLEVAVKGRPLAHAQEGVVDLATARAALLSGAVMGVQVRYRHRGVEWWDTLIRVAEGVKLVRMEAPRLG